MGASIKRITVWGLATLGSLLLGACGAKTPRTGTGTQADELAIPDASSETDGADSREGKDTAQALDSTLVSETMVTQDVQATDTQATDTQTTTDDGCPQWVPIDEPDYGKPQQSPSSLSECTAELPCPEGETCPVDFFLSESITKGACYRPCYHPKSDFPNDLGCDPSQYCMLVRRCLSSQPEPDCDPETGRNMQSVGWCGPKNRTQGGPGGSWDYFGCPCEHPSLTEVKKAECEAGAE